MEILADENLRMWLYTFVVKYRKGRDRDTGMVDEKGEPILRVKNCAITGDELVLTAAWPLYALAKSLLGWQGRRASVHGGTSDLTDEESTLFFAVKDRLARLILRMNGEEPGSWIVNPEVEGLHLGVLKGADPMTAPVSAIRPTYKVLLRAEEAIKGTKWERLVADGAVYEDTPVGSV